jgi:indolepyruvate ferredoxin oxidoreductase beta subunit
MNNTTQPISILLCALGGEGGGVLADWLIEAAQHEGYPAQKPRPSPASRSAPAPPPITLNSSQFRWPIWRGGRPVFGLNPLAGPARLLVSSELLETARQIGNRPGIQRAHAGHYLVIAHAHHGGEDAHRRRSAQ